MAILGIHDGKFDFISSVADSMRRWWDGIMPL